MSRIKWGVVGTAYIFERDTARGMSLADNCELTAIAGRTLEKAEAFKEKYGFQRAYGSLHCRIRCIMSGRFRH